MAEVRIVGKVWGIMSDESCLRHVIRENRVTFFFFFFACQKKKKGINESSYLYKNLLISHVNWKKNMIRPFLPNIKGVQSYEDSVLVGFEIPES